MIDNTVVVLQVILLASFIVVVGALATLIVKMVWDILSYED